MKFWAAALLATGVTASAVLDAPLVHRDNKINLFAEHADVHHHHHDGHAHDGVAVDLDDAALADLHHHHLKNGEVAAAGTHYDHHHHKDAADAADAPFRIPTSYESAVMARRILALTRFGTISTVFPEGAPADRAGVPIALPEYLADCEEDDPAQAGNPTLLAIRIATSFRNARAGSNVSLALQWEPPYPPASGRVSVAAGIQKLLGFGKTDADADAFPPSVAALPRFSLIGYLEPIVGQDDPNSPVASCFVHSHPDAKYWLPGSPVHESEWLRLVVTQVYWVGGFGDRAYIGWIPLEEYQAVTRAEWEKAHLPGERKGWSEADAAFEM